MGQIRLPIPEGTVAYCDPPSALTVAGPCWIFTSFPNTNENFEDSRKNNFSESFVCSRGATWK